jgi:hypothetical protein
MLTIRSAEPRKDREVQEIVDAVRRSKRSIARTIEPSWYWKDLERRAAFAERLHRLVTAPAEFQVPIEEAMELPIALASIVAARYEPVVPRLADVLHDETLAQAKADIAQSLCRNYPTEGTVRRMIEATAAHRVQIDRVFHCGVAVLKSQNDDTNPKRAA